MNAHLPRPSYLGTFRRALPATLLVIMLAFGSMMVAGPGRVSAASIYGATTIAFSSATATMATTTSPAGVTSTASPIVPGGAVVVSGSGYAPGDSVSLTINGQSTPFATLQADGDGSVAGTVTIPASVAPGSYQVNAAGSLSGHTASATLNVGALGAVVDLVSTSVNAGGALEVTGAGFGPNEPINFTFNGTTVGATTPVTTDATGAFSDVSVSIPAATETSALCACSYTLTAKGAISGASSSVLVTVNTPTLILTSAVGNTDTVSGSGFTPGETVNITLIGQPGVLATLQADASGQINGSVPIPGSLVAGSYTLVATGLSSGVTSTAPEIVGSPSVVIPSAASPVLTLGSSAISSGNVLTISGSGFAANEAVALWLNGPLGGCPQLYASGPTLSYYPPSCVLVLTGQLGTGYAAQPISLGSAQADASGQFTYTVAVPAGLAGGLYTVSAIGSSSGDLASISLGV